MCFERAIIGSGEGPQRMGEHRSSWWTRTKNNNKSKWHTRTLIHGLASTLHMRTAISPGQSDSRHGGRQRWRWKTAGVAWRRRTDGSMINNVFTSSMVFFILRIKSAELSLFFPYKDRLNRSLRSKIVCKASYWDCDDCYIKKTKRRLHDRKTEHTLTSNSHSSAIADHITQTGHRIKWNHFDILATGQSDIHCKIKETLWFSI